MNKISMMAVMLSFGISAVCGPLLIPFLRWLKCGQTVREEGPAAHLKKTGTPTMGGILILVSVVLTSVPNSIALIWLLSISTNSANCHCVSFFLLR